MYGDDAIVGKWALSSEEEGMDNLKSSLVSSIDDLVREVLATVRN